MDEPLVSIIIPVYNSAPYLDETIRSALGQTWRHKEIILVDDGSSDGSLAIATKYTEAGVKVFSQPNKGGSSARNKGLSKAKGEYIQFLDGDDLLSVDKISNQMAVLSSKPGWLAISRTLNFYSGEGMPGDQPLCDQQIEYHNDPVKFAVDMYYKGGIEGNWGFVAVHSWLSPKHVLDKAGPWNEELSVDDDGEYFCRVMLEADGIVYVPDAIDYYRRYRTGDNLSAKKNEWGMRSRLLANELKYKCLKAATDDPAVNKAMARIFKDNAVSFYPEYQELYRVAMDLVKETGGSDYVPTLGGPATELVKKIFGWRAAKLLTHKFGGLRR